MTKRDILSKFFCEVWYIILKSYDYHEKTEKHLEKLLNKVTGFLFFFVKFVYFMLNNQSSNL